VAFLLYLLIESMKESESVVVIGQLLGFRKKQDAVYEVVLYML